jgi:hypothetical protein
VVVRVSGALSEQALRGGVAPAGRELEEPEQRDRDGGGELEVSHEAFGPGDVFDGEREHPEREDHGGVGHCDRDPEDHRLHRARVAPDEVRRGERLSVPR